MDGSSPARTVPAWCELTSMPVPSVNTNRVAHLADQPAGLADQDLVSANVVGYPGDFDAAIASQGDPVLGVGQILGEQPPVDAAPSRHVERPHRNTWGCCPLTMAPCSLPISCTWPRG